MRKVAAGKIWMAVPEMKRAPRSRLRPWALYDQQTVRRVDIGALAGGGVAHLLQHRRGGAVIFDLEHVLKTDASIISPCATTECF